MTQSSAPPPSLQLRFTDWADLRTLLLWLYEGEPGARHFRGVHPENCSAWYLHAGRVRVAAHGSRPRLAQAGQWVLLPPGHAQFDFSDDARILSLHYQAQWPDGRPLFPHRRPVIVDGSSHPDLLQVVAPLRRIVARRFAGVGSDLSRQTVDAPTYFRFQQRLQDWLLRLADVMAEAKVPLSTPDPGDDRALAARRLLDAQLKRNPFAERTLSKQIGLSPRQLDRIFVRQFGQTPRAYADGRRLEMALWLLRQGELPAKQIAFQLGFRQPSHFTHWFHARTGQSPRNWREKIQETRATAQATQP
jgi:AraC-like DNA-binding protein